LKPVRWFEKTFTLGKVYKQYYPRDKLEVANALALITNKILVPSKV